MMTTVTVVVSTPDGTEGVTDAIAYALDQPDSYPDGTDTSEWGISVYDMADLVPPDAITRIAGLFASMAGESAMIREAIGNEVPGAPVSTSAIEQFIRDGAA